MDSVLKRLASLKQGARDYAGILKGTYHYLRTSPPKEWEPAIREGIRNRETRFLKTLRRGVFSDAEHPYTKMFQLAGWSYDRVEKAIDRDGLESTLQALHQQGVWLSHDELKGKTAIVRSGKPIASHSNSFSNPLIGDHASEYRSGGSRSKGTRIRQSAAYRVHTETYHLLNNLEFDLASRHHVMVRPILPSQTAISQCLRHLRLGGKVEHWFAIAGGEKGSARYRNATRSCVWMAWAFGLRVPFPEFLPQNNLEPVAEWVARQRDKGIDCVVWSSVSTAARIAEAALARNLDMRGTLFLSGDETLTAAKRARIESAGARIYTRYVITEVGPVGFACNQMHGNCVHLFRDSIAVITHRRPAPISGMEVNSLLFSTLAPWAPHILINAEMDDSGLVEPASCDCAFSGAGFKEQIRNLYSFGKLTGHGMTLVGGDVLHLLEVLLPARFGGGPGDYQLVETEGASQTELDLRVSPRVKLRSADAVRDFFLQEIRKLYGGTASNIWRYTESVKAMSMEPAVTPGGKVLPLHLLGPGTEGADAT